MRTLTWKWSLNYTVWQEICQVFPRKVKKNRPSLRCKRHYKTLRNNDGKCLRFLSERLGTVSHGTCWLSPVKEQLWFIHDCANRAHPFSIFDALIFIQFHLFTLWSIHFFPQKNQWTLYKILTLNFLDF